MKEELDKKLESFVDRAMRETSLEKTPKDFTASIMAKLNEQEAVQSRYYQPLISTKAWMFVGFAILIFLFIVLNESAPQQENWQFFDGFNTLWVEFLSSTMNKIFSHRSVYYFIGFLSVFTFIQVPFLRYYLTQRIESLEE